jgi:16S rRNA (cytidine1402-2'-O)-methyltransferase
VALVSDAGTPLVSDPGYRLVRETIDAGIEITAIPGPSSVLAALVVSGLPSDRFFFGGFPPHKQGARRSFLTDCATVPATLIFLESPRRLAASLADMAAAFGEREAAIARELTKLHEEVRRGSLSDLADSYAATDPPKGEVVVVVAPPGEAPVPSIEEIDATLNERLAAMSVRDAVDAVTASTGLPRKQVYARALELSARHRDGKR